ncbi:threonine-phosphate decarboxylase CobD [Algicella marina]|uniref:threonine-phosphate decarboxylase n=1 Tax=Algicella marina TaxID=2683284 RepID=A0A6P1SXM7_9RHOB|nr:threonine-phosphate decarboxylase CobD [Algicella marina]QHQ33966.1 threonine-phosphate decarboxylase [Algicella marina]
MSRDHGGNLGAAIARYGGQAENWIDLSTGINRQPYPLPAIPAHAWQALPTAEASSALVAAARAAYRTDAALLPLAGAQAAIQLLPRLRPPGTVHVLEPTYNEHAASFRAAGWTVRSVATPAALPGADAAVIVNPNNPDGRLLDAGEILALSRDIPLLIVDESFMDPTPKSSIAPHLGTPGLIALRSFGKFYGLAGLRLGFAAGAQADIAALSAAAGPWAASGPALHVGRMALLDTKWQQATSRRLHTETRRLDALAEAAGWRSVGGTALFRLYQTPGAEMAQSSLARSAIWSRIFPYSESWLRLGLPGSAAEWSRLTAALA